MTENLALLCARAVAKDHSTKGYAQLRTILGSAVPTAVMSTALSLLPINRLMELEKEFPDYAKAFEKQWTELCEKCAQKHVPFRKKLQRMLSGADTEEVDHRALFLNAFFPEVLDAVRCNAAKNVFSAKVPRMSGQYILQQAIGPCRHDNPDKDMLHILARQISELTLNSKNISDLREFIRSNQDCMHKIETLKLDCCVHIGGNIINCSLWTSCIQNLMDRAQMARVSIRECSPILNDVIKICAKVQATLVKSSLWDAAVSGAVDHVGGSHVDKNDSSSGLYDNLTGGEDSSTCQSVKQFKVTPCYKPVKGWLEGVFYIGLESWYALEKLEVSFHSYFDLNHFLTAIEELFKSGSSLMKHLHIFSACLSQHQIGNLAQYFSRANDFEKEIIFRDCKITCEYTAPKFSTSTISKLVFSHTMWDAFGFAEAIENGINELSFNHLLRIFNPQHFYICDEYESAELPIFTPRNALSTSGEIRLQRVSVVISLTFSSAVRLFSLILSLLSSIMPERLRFIDVYALIEGTENCEYDFSKFRNVKICRPKSSCSLHSTEDYVSQMGNSTVTE